MSDNSDDDRFPRRPVAGAWRGRDAEADDESPEPESGPASAGLPLPPPGLFARLAAPTEASLDTEPDSPPDEADLPPRDERANVATPNASMWARVEAPAPGSEFPGGELPSDEEELRADDEDAPVPAAPLAGVSGAVDVVEQLGTEPAAEEAESEPEEPDVVFATAAEGIAARNRSFEADDPEPETAEAAPDEPRYRLPAYALRTRFDETAEADPPPLESEPPSVESEPPSVESEPPSVEAERPPATLPKFGADRTGGAASEEILPQFLLDDTTSLDVVGAQTELRAMARQGRKNTDEGRPGLARTLAEIPLLLLVAAVIAFLVKTFLAQAYYIPSGSMLPQLQVDDRVVVSKLAYKFHDPRRGDVVVFDEPETGATTVEEEVERSGVSKLLRKVGEGVGVVQPSTDEFIKRVIALPGETVEARGGDIYINDHKLIEPYLPESTRTEDFAPQTVAKGKLWVMGDNRGQSADSRFFGQIDVDSIVGRAVVRVWPFSHASFL